MGLSGYFGDTQVHYTTVLKKMMMRARKADSSVVGISMVGLDARYNLKGLHCAVSFTG
jgi:hypothetical protein